MFFKFITFCVICVGLAGCDGPQNRCPKSAVKEVGACDRHGWCGVVLEDGSIVDVRYPIKAVVPTRCYSY